MSDVKTPPIEPQDYIGGVKVVDIGDIRVARGLSRRPISICPHRQLTYDQKERRIWCADCETDIEAFDAFLSLIEGYDKGLRAVAAEKERLKESEQFVVRSLAAKEIDKAWRCRTTVPACPHCHHGLFPEDFKNGVGTLGRDYAAKRLGRDPA